MANAFNIDKGGSTTSDTHLINETFHVFSKSPGSPTTSLGGARLKSGHTTTTSDVWSDEIPAFFKAATQAKFDLFSTKAVKDDLCLFNGNVYQHNGTEFVSLGTEAEVLVDGATFKKNDKDVIKFHKGRTAINLTADNNNGDGSNNYTAKIYDAAEGSTTFVPQFISAMDKMVDGIPSLAYDAAVFAGGSQLAEGLTADNDYICNAYAGVIQFNKARSSGVTVNAWEYIGDKLTTSISGLRQSIKDISDVTLKGVVASVTADANTAQKAGITVDTTVSTTTPVIKFTGGSVTTGETKLVSGDAVKTYVDTTALAEGGSIAKAIADYVSTNAKVTLTADTTDGKTGITITPNGQESTSFTIGIDQTKIATKQSVDDLSSLVSGLPATIKAAQDTADEALGLAETAVQSVTKASDSSSLLTVTDGTDVTISLSTEVATKTDITTEINKLSAADGIITALTTRVGEAEANAAASASAASASETAAKSAQSASESAASNAAASKTAAEGAQSAAEAAASDAATSASAAQAAQSAAEGSASSASQSASAATAAQSAAEAAQAAAEAAQAVVETTADWVAGTDEELGKFSDATASGVVTGTTVKTVADEVLTLAKAYSKGLHTTSVTYHVTETLPTVPAGKEEEYKGRIYLVTTGKDGVVAADGSRIEYMYVNEGTEEAPSWDWEQIGTTTADLAGYASTVATGQATTLANQGSVYGHIADDGTLTLGVASATDSVMGVSKMFTGNLSSTSSSTDAKDTAVSVKSAQAMYSSLATLADSKVAGVVANFYLGLAGIAVTESNNVVTISDTFVSTKHRDLSLNAKSVINGVVTTDRVDEPYAKRPIATSKIVNGAGMFEDGMNLTTWVDDLECLTSGYAMFAGCDNLTTFIGDLGALTNGKGMFRDCQLSLESVEYISDTINDVTELTDDETDDGNAKIRKQFDFGYSVMPEEMNALNTAIAEIKAKGWTVYANKMLQ